MYFIKSKFIHMLDIKNTSFEKLNIGSLFQKIIEMLSVINRV